MDLLLHERAFHSLKAMVKEQESQHLKQNFLSFVKAFIKLMSMPHKKRVKTINPVDNGAKQHSITEYWDRKPIKIVLKPAKPKSESEP